MTLEKIRNATGSWSLRSLHGRLAWLTAGTLVASILCYGAYLADRQSKLAGRLIEQQSVAMGRNLAATATSYLITTNLSALEQLLLMSAQFPGVRRIEVVDASGLALSHVEVAADEQAKVVFAERRRAVPSQESSHTQKYSHSIEVWEPVYAESLVGWVVVESSLDEAAAIERTIFENSLLAAAIAAVLSVVVLLMLLSRPLRSLRVGTQFAENLDRLKGQTLHLGSRVVEIATLERALNRASARLSSNEQALLETAGWLEAILANAIDAIITVDEQGNILSFNPAAERVFGFSAGEVLGLGIGRLMAEPFRSSASLFLKRPSAQRTEIVGVTGNDEPFPMELGVSLIRRGANLAYAVIVRDLTESKRVEQMQSEFISMVSHELRTPLTSIRGSLSLLRSGVAGRVPEDVANLVEIGLRNSERLIRIVNDVLCVGKLGSIDDGLEFSLGAVSVSTLLAQSLDENRPFAEQHGVSLVLEPPEFDDLMVYGDAARLSQVLANLLSNAAKFSPVGSRVTLSARLVDLVVRVEVVDQGDGIPQQFQGSVFKKFAQADASDSRKRGGTGLGLHICKAIVERHAGRIGFESVVGQGSRFFFEMRCWRAKQVDAGVSTQTLASGSLPVSG